MKTVYTLIINTDHYSGNFERQICAYATGELGECGVGDAEALAFKQDPAALKFNFSKAIISLADDRGCKRPATIHPTEGWYNNGMGGHFKEEAGSEVKANLERIQSTFNYKIEHLQDELKTLSNKKSSEEDKNQAGQQVVNFIKEMKKVINTTKLTKWPAYQSVAIFFNRKLTEEELSLVSSRAKDFAKKNKIVIDKIELKKMTLADAKRIAKH